LIDKASDLPRRVGSLKPGSRSQLTVFRRGKEVNLAVTIGEFEAEQTAAAKPKEPARKAAASMLGLTVTDLTDEQKKALNVRGGVLVESAVDAAARAGLREGDVILALSNVQVTSVREFEALLARLDKNRPINVLFRRGEWAQYAVIRPSR